MENSRSNLYFSVFNTCGWNNIHHLERHIQNTHGRQVTGWSAYDHKYQKSWHNKLIVHVLSEGVPHGVDFDSVNDVLLAVGGVKSTHSLHMWSLTTSETHLSVHAVIGKT